MSKTRPGHNQAQRISIVLDHRPIPMGFSLSKSKNRPVEVPITTAQRPPGSQKVIRIVFVFAGVGLCVMGPTRHQGGNSLWVTIRCSQINGTDVDIQLCTSRSQRAFSAQITYGCAVYNLSAAHVLLTSIRPPSSDIQGSGLPTCGKKPLVLDARF
jgi:hypothetical protein